MSETKKEDEILYLNMGLCRWNDCEGIVTGSIGFMEVFDDVDTLKKAHPGAEIQKITMLGAHR